MKKLIQLSSLAVMLLISCQLQAQYLRLQGGLNLANMINQTNDTSFHSNYTNRAGFHAGFVGGMAFGHLGVEGGLLLSSKGFNDENTIELGNGDIQRTVSNLSILYLDVPIDLKASLGHGGVGLFATAGIVFSYGLSGFYSEEVLLNDQSMETSKDKITWGSGTDAHLKSADFGVSLGGGFDVGNINMGVKYTWGLNNIAPSTENGAEIKNKVLQVTLGLKFLQ
jgi:hypothetical protein